MLLCRGGYSRKVGYPDWSMPSCGAGCIWQLPGKQWQQIRAAIQLNGPAYWLVPVAFRGGTHLWCCHQQPAATKANCLNLQDDSFLLPFSQTSLIGGGDSLTVLDLSENDFTDGGVAVLAGSMELDGEPATVQWAAASIPVGDVVGCSATTVVVQQQLAATLLLDEAANLQCLGVAAASSAVYDAMLHCRPQVPAEAAGYLFQQAGR